MIIPPEMHRLFLLFGCEGAGGLETLADYLAQAKAPQRRVRMAEVLEWAERTFSGLEPRVAWNQPVFTDHGTFIVGISVSAGHLAVSPGRAWRAFSGTSPGAAMPGQNAVPHPVGEGRGLHAAAPDDRLQPHRKGPLQDFLAGEGMTAWIPWRARALLAGIYLPRSDTRGALCPAVPAGSGPLRRKSAKQTAVPGPCRMGKTPCISRGQARHWTENLRNHAGGSAPPGQRRTTHAQPAAI